MKTLEQRLHYILQNAHQPETWFALPLAMEDLLFLSRLNDDIGLVVNNVLDSAINSSSEMIIHDDMRARILELISIRKKIQELLPIEHKLLVN